MFITSTLGSGNSEKLWVLKAIAITELGIDSLRDLRASMKICQEYANYGINRLYDMHVNSSDELSEHSRKLNDILSDDFGAE